jgi:hypothetical protein
MSSPASSIRVFVNSGVLEVPAGTDAAEAVRRFDPALGERVAAGEAYVTDARGIEVGPAETLASGAILRVVVRARRQVDADA